MDIQWFVETVLFRGLGGSLLIAAVMLALMTFGVPVSQRVHKVASAIALAPLLILVVLLGAALARRGFGA